MAKEKKIERVSDLMREMKDVYDRIRDGSLDTKKGNSLIYALSNMANLYTKYVMDEKLADMERLVDRV